MPGYGVKGRSGRPRGGFKEYTPGNPPPALNPDSYQSRQAFRLWVTQELASGNIDRADARELLAAIDDMRKDQTAQYSQKELDDLRLLVERAEAASRRADALEVADRYALSAPNLP